MRCHFPLIVLIAFLFDGCIVESQLTVGERLPEYETPSCPTIDLNGKTFWTIWDSLGDDSNWQPLFSQLSGAIYYPDLNDRYLSFGGTNSNPASLNGTQARCKKLLGLKDNYPIDIILLENINDMSFLENESIGSLVDSPFMMGEKWVVHKGSLLSYEDAKQYLESKLDSIVESVPSAKRNRGVMLSVPYKDSNVKGFTIRVSSSAYDDGDVIVKIGGNTINIPVKAGMTNEEILQQMLWGGYNPGWVIVDNGDGTLTLSFYTNSNTRVSVDENGTGIQLKLSEDKATRELVVYYLGNSSSEWCTMDNWKMDLSLYSIYKGVIEYLRENLPMAQLFWVIPSYFNVDCEDFKLLDDFGNYSWEKYVEKDSYKNWANLCRIQKAVCKLYGIPVLDISENCGININNFLQFYNCGNVHPKKEGYNRWAETLYNMMK